MNIGFRENFLALGYSYNEDLGHMEKQYDGYTIIVYQSASQICFTSDHQANRMRAFIVIPVCDLTIESASLAICSIREVIKILKS